MLPGGIQLGSYNKANNSGGRVRLQGRDCANSGGRVRLRGWDCARGGGVAEREEGRGAASARSPPPSGRATACRALYDRLTVYESSGDGDMSIKEARQEPASSPPPRPHLFALSPVATVTLATGGKASPPRPAPVRLGQGWMQYFDDDTGRSYYHNYCTHAAGQWARPPGL
jgi:hypothetical protein